MSFTVSNNIPSPATLDKSAQSSTAPGNGVHDSQPKKAGASLGPVNDNVSLSKTAEVVSQDVDKSNNTGGTEIKEAKVLDAKSALEAMRMVQNSILQNAETSVQSQANQTPGSVVDLLSNDVE